LWLFVVVFCDQVEEIVQHILTSCVFAPDFLFFEYWNTV
jgi:hypothetical protein